MPAYQWDGFINHALEDKDAVARPLAARPEKDGVRVWLDANELTRKSHRPIGKRPPFVA